MSSLTATASSPTSFQLRLALSCRQPHVGFIRMKLDRQFRVYSVSAGDSARKGNGNSWTTSSSSSDVFAGWSGADGGERPVTDSEKKPWFKGIAGAGVAGVVLVAGLTFATLSISKRSTSRPTPVMEPLTTQQEKQLTSDSENHGVGEDEKEGKDLKDDDYLSRTAGENEASSREDSEATINDGQNVSTIENATSNGDVVDELPVQDSVQNNSANGEVPDLPESGDANGSFVASDFEYSKSSLISGISESATELEENLDDAKVTNLSGSDETDSLQMDPLPSIISVNSELNSTIDPQIIHEENVDALYTLSTREDVDLRNTDASAEEVETLSEEHNLDGVAPSGTASVLDVVSTSANEQDVSARDSIDHIESTDTRTSFSFAGIPAPSVPSAALHVLPGKVLVPAVVDAVQGQALAALQVLKVIEAEVQPGDLCTRREYARWLVSASSILSRSTVSKVYPAMFIEDVSELAFDDITPEDPDFPSIQGLAEAGLIFSKLSRRDMSPLEEDQSPVYFSPESLLSRQDLVTWKMALEKRQLPEADKKILYQLSGFIDTDKINIDACPALVADIASGENGIVALAFGYTRLFQPDKPVTKAQAAIALATGEASDMVSEELARIEAESMAENVVAAHSALVAQVEKDVNASFEKELITEREKISAIEKLADEARQELERLRARREEDSIALMKERAAVESEMEVLTRLRREVEQQLESLVSNKVEISYEKEKLSKLLKDAENENQEITRLQHDLEVERKALSMARTWAEDEAKRAREQAKILEEARERWGRHGIKVVVDEDLREDAANVGVTWSQVGEPVSVEETVTRAENLVDKLKAMAANVGEKSKIIISRIIEKILSLVSILKEWASGTVQKGGELKDAASSKIGSSLQELQKSTAELTSAVKEGAKRVAGDCKQEVGKITQKFKPTDVSS